MVGENVENLKINILGMMIKLNAVLDKDYPFPSLTSIRDERETAVTGNSVKNRAQRVCNCFEGVFRTKKRLHLFCPYDDTVIPCGLDGNGYPFHGTREWVKKLYPVVQVNTFDLCCRYFFQIDTLTLTPTHWLS
ncbi:unnamed protein product [Choristocarpus tenellus]